MNQAELKQRTKNLALEVIRVFGDLPQSKAGSVISRQVLRSSTSVGANYRAACRARSRAEMISKLSVVLEEADETLYWFELAEESGVVAFATIQDMHREADEIVRIIVATLKSLKGLTDQNLVCESTPINYDADDSWSPQSLLESANI